MADRVIVVGVRRGKERIQISEITQMVGRAGRTHDGRSCRADIIVEEDDFEDVRLGMESNDSLIVCSSLSSVDELSFHILPEICNNNIKNVMDAEKWYSMSFGAFQGKKPKFDKVFAVLKLFEAIRITPVGFMATDLGLISSRLYFHPGDVMAWRDNFGTIFKMGLERDDLAIAWALGNVPHTRISGDFGKHWYVVGECKGNMPLGLEIVEGTSITITLWWSAIGGPSVGKMRNQMLGMRDNFGRIYHALVGIDQNIMHWGMKEFFDDLLVRVNKGIPSVLAELCKLPGITKNRAAYLYNMGVRDVEGIKDVINSLDDDIDEGFVQALRNIANGIHRESSSSL
jgi:replicative superfamily II helicase